MTPEQVDEALGQENQWRIEDGMDTAGPRTDVFYQEEGGGVVLGVVFRNHRLTDKRLQRVPQTLGDLLRG
jgi:hypothetical protein